METASASSGSGSGHGGVPTEAPVMGVVITPSPHEQLSLKLFTLVQNNDIDGVQLLFRSLPRQEAKDIANSKYPDGFSILHWASQKYNGVPFVSCLVENGADINYCGGPLSETVLHSVAKFDGNLHVLKYLIDSGANLQVKNVYGHDALSAACQNGCIHNAFVL
jgi:ankyrin repeat protein